MGKKGPVMDNKVSSILGLINAAKIPILVVLASAAIGAYFLGPYGLLCGLGVAILFRIKAKFMIGEKVKVGVSAPDAPVITMDGTTVNLLSYAQGDRPLVLNFGSFS